MAHARSILDIPLELAHEICELLSPQDIMEARFLSKAFAAAGFKQLITRHQVFELIPESVARLETIAKVPACSELVRSLTYDTDGLDELVHYVPRLPGSDFSPFSRRRVGEDEEDRDTARWAAATHQYKHEHCGLDSRAVIREFQNELAESTVESRNVYKRVLQQFPNLDAICLFSARAGVIRTHRSNTSTSSTVVRDSAQRRVFHPGADQLEDVLCVAATNVARLSSLTAFPVPWVFFQRFARMDPIKHDTAREVGLALQWLKTLSLVIEICNFSNLSADEDHKTLAQFLDKTNRLEELVLRFTFIGMSSRSMPDTFDLHTSLHGFEWPCLRILHLDNATIEPNSFLDFIQAHATTLKDLSLTTMTLSSGNWAEILDKINAATNLSHLRINRSLSSFDPTRHTLLHATVRADGKITMNIPQECHQDFIAHIELFAPGYSLGQILTRQGDPQADLNFKCLTWWNNHRSFDGLYGRCKARRVAKIPVLHLRR